MPTINVEVKNKIARQTSKELYVCGNSDFVIAFDFDAEWDAHHTKTARFKYGGSYQEVVFTGNECPMPVISNVNKIQVGVYAGDLQSTTAATILAWKSILCGGGTHEDPPEDVYNQLMEMMNNILARLEALENGGGGEPDNPDVPDIPDEPVVTRLAAPVIYLESDEGGDDGDDTDDPVIKKLTAPVIRLETVDEPDDGGTDDDSEYTPAILGVAILGRTILGKTDGYEPTITQLTAPSIRIETEDEEEEPTIVQLTAPSIKLETVVYTLDAPEIELVEV